MRNDTMRIYLSHHELLLLIAIVRAVKQGATRQHNKAEARLANSLLRALLNFDIDYCGTAVILDCMTRYALWNYVEQYIGFCVETRQHSEYATAVMIATKLSG